MRLRYYILAIFATILIFFGCSPTKHLKENQYLLYKQSIEGNKKILLENLTPFYAQKPNRKILGFSPYISLYNIGLSRYDTVKINNEINKARIKLDTIINHQKKNIRFSKKDSTKLEKNKAKFESTLEKLNIKLREGNWVMRAPGEAPAIFDSSLMNETSGKMEYYLKSKGFFQAKVTPQIDTSGKKIHVTYNIQEGNSYQIKKIVYEIEDPEISKIVNANLSNTYLKKNERYEEDKLTAERERLTKLLKNNGYFDFTRQFIFVDIDTSSSRGAADIYVMIKDPQGKTHSQYIIDTIIFNTDVSVHPDETRDTSDYNEVKYVFYKDNFSKRILGNKLRIKPGNLYNQKEVQQSQIQLASLDMYKFVNITFEKSEDTASKTLTAFVRASPFNKYQVSDEWGVNVGQGFIPGPYVSLSFKDRNVFGGFEIFEASLRYSFEAVYSQVKHTHQDQPIIMKEYGGNLSLSFPQIFFPVLGKRANNYSPKTKIIASYNFVNRPEYTRAILRNALTYNWQKSANKFYNVALIDINLVHTPRLDDGYKARLANLPALKVSFSNIVITSFNFSYTYNDNQFGIIKKSKYFRPYFEIGGNAANFLSKHITHESGDQLLGLKYFQFFKLSADLRYYIPTGKKNTLAIRFFGGYASPFGNSAKNGIFAIPYEKYFFAGGSSDIRAWRPRRLGPGSYKDTTNGYLYEQPGNIMFETNYEFRKHVFKYLEMAAFIDAGNTWTINKDTARIGSQFQFNKFLGQIAVGTGIGFRFNFTFLILRLDIGIKVWDPGNKPGEKFVGKYIWRKPPFGQSGQTVYNIGIGYPF